MNKFSVCVVGDSRTGKTTLISQLSHYTHTAAHNYTPPFSHTPLPGLPALPPCLDPIIIPAALRNSGVGLQITDSPSSTLSTLQISDISHSLIELRYNPHISPLFTASAIVLCVNIAERKTIKRVITYWLPLLSLLCPHIPVIISANYLPSLLFTPNHELHTILTEIKYNRALLSRFYNFRWISDILHCSLLFSPHFFETQAASTKYADIMKLHSLLFPNLSQNVVNLMNNYYFAEVTNMIAAMKSGNTDYNTNNVQSGQITPFFSPRSLFSHVESLIVMPHAPLYQDIGGPGALLNYITTDMIDFVENREKDENDAIFTNLSPSTHHQYFTNQLDLIKDHIYTQNESFFNKINMTLEEETEKFETTQFQPRDIITITPSHITTHLSTLSQVYNISINTQSISQEKENQHNSLSNHENVQQSQPHCISGRSILLAPIPSQLLPNDTSNHFTGSTNPSTIVPSSTQSSALFSFSPFLHSYAIYSTVLLSQPLLKCISFVFSLCVAQEGLSSPHSFEGIKGNEIITFLNFFYFDVIIDISNDPVTLTLNNTDTLENTTNKCTLSNVLLNNYYHLNHNKKNLKIFAGLTGNNPNNSDPHSFTCNDITNPMGHFDGTTDTLQKKTQINAHSSNNPSSNWTHNDILVDYRIKAIPNKVSAHDNTMDTHTTHHFTLPFSPLGQPPSISSAIPSVNPILQFSPLQPSNLTSFSDMYQLPLKDYPHSSNNMKNFYFPTNHVNNPENSLLPHIYIYNAIISGLHTTSPSLLFDTTTSQSTLSPHYNPQIAEINKYHSNLQTKFPWIERFKAIFTQNTAFSPYSRFSHHFLPQILPSDTLSLEEAQELVYILLYHRKTAQIWRFIANAWRICHFYQVCVTFIHTVVAAMGSNISSKHTQSNGFLANALQIYQNTANMVNGRTIINNNKKNNNNNHNDNNNNNDNNDNQSNNNIDVGGINDGNFIQKKNQINQGQNINKISINRTGGSHHGESDVLGTNMGENNRKMINLQLNRGQCDYISNNNQSYVNNRNNAIYSSFSLSATMPTPQLDGFLREFHTPVPVLSSNLHHFIMNHVICRWSDTNDSKLLKSLYFPTSNMFMPSLQWIVHPILMDMSFKYRWDRWKIEKMQATLIYQYKYTRKTRQRQELLSSARTRTESINNNKNVNNMLKNIPRDEKTSYVVKNTVYPHKNRRNDAQNNLFSINGRQHRSNSVERESNLSHQNFNHSFDNNSVDLNENRPKIDNSSYTGSVGAKITTKSVKSTQTGQTNGFETDDDGDGNGDKASNIIHHTNLTSAWHSTPSSNINTKMSLDKNKDIEYSKTMPLKSLVSPFSFEYLTDESEGDDSRDIDDDDDDLDYFPFRSDVRALPQQQQPNLPQSQKINKNAKKAQEKTREILKYYQHISSFSSQLLSNYCSEYNFHQLALIYSHLCEKNGQIAQNSLIFGNIPNTAQQSSKYSHIPPCNLPFPSNIPTFRCQHDDSNANGYFLTQITSVCDSNASKVPQKRDKTLNNNYISVDRGSFYGVTPFISAPPALTLLPIIDTTAMSLQQHYLSQKILRLKEYIQQISEYPQEDGNNGENYEKIIKRQKDSEKLDSNLFLPHHTHFIYQGAYNELSYIIPRPIPPNFPQISNFDDFSTPIIPYSPLGLLMNIPAYYTSTFPIVPSTSSTTQLVGHSVYSLGDPDKTEKTSPNAYNQQKQTGTPIKSEHISLLASNANISMKIVKNTGSKQNNAMVVQNIQHITKSEGYRAYRLRKIQEILPLHTTPVPILYNYYFQLLSNIYDPNLKQFSVEKNRENGHNIQKSAFFHEKEIHWKNLAFLSFFQSILPLINSTTSPHLLSPVRHHNLHNHLSYTQNNTLFSFFIESTYRLYTQHVIFNYSRHFAKKNAMFLSKSAKTVQSLVSSHNLAQYHTNPLFKQMSTTQVQFLYTLSTRITLKNHSNMEKHVELMNKYPKLGKYAENLKKTRENTEKYPHAYYELCFSKQFTPILHHIRRENTPNSIKLHSDANNLRISSAYTQNLPLITTPQPYCLEIDPKTGEFEKISQIDVKPLDVDHILDKNPIFSAQNIISPQLNDAHFYLSNSTISLLLHLFTVCDSDGDGLLFGMMQTPLVHNNYDDLIAKKEKKIVQNPFLHDFNYVETPTQMALYTLSEVTRKISEKNYLFNGENVVNSHDFNINPQIFAHLPPNFNVLATISQLLQHIIALTKQLYHINHFHTHLSQSIEAYMDEHHEKNVENMSFSLRNEPNYTTELDLILKNPYFLELVLILVSEASAFISNQLHNTSKMGHSSSLFNMIDVFTREIGNLRDNTINFSENYHQKNSDKKLDKTVSDIDELDTIVRLFAQSILSPPELHQNNADIPVEDHILSSQHQQSPQLPISSKNCLKSLNDPHIEAILFYIIYIIQQFSRTLSPLFSPHSNSHNDNTHLTSLSHFIHSLHYGDFALISHHATTTTTTAQMQLLLAPLFTTFISLSGLTQYPLQPEAYSHRLQSLLIHLSEKHPAPHPYNLQKTRASKSEKPIFNKTSVSALFTMTMSLTPFTMDRAAWLGYWRYICGIYPYEMQKFTQDLAITLIFKGKLGGPGAYLMGNINISQRYIRNTGIGSVMMHILANFTGFAQNNTSLNQKSANIRDFIKKSVLAPLNRHDISQSSHDYHQIETLPKFSTFAQNQAFMRQPHNISAKTTLLYNSIYDIELEFSTTPQNYIKNVKDDEKYEKCEKPSLFSPLLSSNSDSISPYNDLGSTNLPPQQPQRAINAIVLGWSQSGKTTICETFSRQLELSPTDNTQYIIKNRKNQLFAQKPTLYSASVPTWQPMCISCVEHTEKCYSFSNSPQKQKNGVLSTFLSQFDESYQKIIGYNEKPTKITSTQHSMEVHFNMLESPFQCHHHTPSRRTQLSSELATCSLLSEYKQQEELIKNQQIHQPYQNFENPDITRPENIIFMPGSGVGAGNISSLSHKTPQITKQLHRIQQGVEPISTHAHSLSFPLPVSIGHPNYQPNPLNQLPNNVYTIIEEGHHKTSLFPSIHHQNSLFATPTRFTASTTPETTISLQSCVPWKLNLFKDSFSHHLRRKCDNHKKSNNRNYKQFFNLVQPDGDVNVHKLPLSHSVRPVTTLHTSQKVRLALQSTHTQASLFSKNQKDINSFKDIAPQQQLIMEDFLCPLLDQKQSKMSLNSLKIDQNSTKLNPYHSLLVSSVQGAVKHIAARSTHKGTNLLDSDGKPLVASSLDFNRGHSKSGQPETGVHSSNDGKNMENLNLVTIPSSGIDHISSDDRNLSAIDNNMINQSDGMNVAHTSAILQAKDAGYYFSHGDSSDDADDYGTYTVLSSLTASSSGDGENYFSDFSFSSHSETNSVDLSDDSSHSTISSHSIWSSQIPSNTVKKVGSINGDNKNDNKILNTMLGDGSSVHGTAIDTDSESTLSTASSYSRVGAPITDKSQKSSSKPMRTSQNHTNTTYGASSALLSSFLHAQLHPHPQQHLTSLTNQNTQSLSKTSTIKKYKKSQSHPPLTTTHMQQMTLQTTTQHTPLDVVIIAVDPNSILSVLYAVQLLLALPQHISVLIFVTHIDCLPTTTQNTPQTGISSGYDPVQLGNITPQGGRGIDLFTQFSLPQQQQKVSGNQQLFRNITHFINTMSDCADISQKQPRDLSGGTDINDNNNINNTINDNNNNDNVAIIAMYINSINFWMQIASSPTSHQHNVSPQTSDALLWLLFEHYASFVLEMATQDNILVLLASLLPYHVVLIPFVPQHVIEQSSDLFSSINCQDEGQHTFYHPQSMSDHLTTHFINPTSLSAQSPWVSQMITDNNTTTNSNNAQYNQGFAKSQQVLSHFLPDPMLFSKVTAAATLPQIYSLAACQIFMPCIPEETRRQQEYNYKMGILLKVVKFTFFTFLLSSMVAIAVTVGNTPIEDEIDGQKHTVLSHYAQKIISEIDAQYGSLCEYVHGLNSIQTTNGDDSSQNNHEKYTYTGIMYDRIMNLSDAVYTMVWPSNENAENMMTLSDFFTKTAQKLWEYTTASPQSSLNEQSSLNDPSTRNIPDFSQLAQQCLDYSSTMWYDYLWQPLSRATLSSLSLFFDGGNSHIENESDNHD